MLRLNLGHQRAPNRSHHAFLLITKHSNSFLLLNYYACLRNALSKGVTQTKIGRIERPSAATYITLETREKDKSIA